jgi:hypothetical protein
MWHLLTLSNEILNERRAQKIRARLLMRRYLWRLKHATEVLKLNAVAKRFRKL